MKLTTVYDNYVYLDSVTVNSNELKSEWGFSCAIEISDELILFDTGGDGSILLHNMKELRIDPGEIGRIVLSHEHWDHTGGLSDLLELNHDALVHLLNSFSEPFKNEIKNPVVGIKEPSKICDLVYTTGELGTSPKEQSLVLETADGMLVLTGCAHPGVGTILESASRFGEVCGVIGGFHGFDDYSILSKLAFLSPSHCTQNLSEIISRFPGAYHKNGVGRVFTVE